MTSANNSPTELLSEIEDLRNRLEETEDTLRAIGNGEVDAFVLSGPDGDQVFTLKGAEQSYRILVESMNQGAATLAMDGTIVYCNKRLAALLETPMERLVGTEISAYIAPAERSLFTARLETGAQENTTAEIAMITATGMTLPVLVSSSGNDGGISVVFTDLTQQKRNDSERKRAEEALWLERNLLRTIIDSTSDLVFIKNRDSAYLACNKASERLVGLAESEQIGKTDSVFFDQEMASRIRENDLQVIAGGKPLRTEEWVTYPDGCRVLLDTLKVPFYGTSGEIQGLVGICRDITERRQAEEQIRNAERRKSILDRISTCFLTLQDEKVYGDVLDVVLEVMESKHGIFGFIAGNGDLVIPSMTRDVWEICSIPDKTIVFPPDSWGNSLWGRAIREKTAFFANETFHTPEGHIRIDNFLTVPIIFGGKTIGLLSVGNKEGGYCEEDKELQELIAARISPILNARQQRDREAQERDQASKELKRKKDELEESQRVAQIGNWTWNACTDSIICSDEYYRIYGLDPALPTPNYQDHLQIYTPESAAKLDAAVARAMRTGEPYALELELVNPEEGKEWVLALGETKQNSEGEIIGLRGTAQNITKRKVAEKQLKEAVSYNRSLIEASLDPLVTINADGKITDVNIATENVTGCSRKELIGTDFSDYFIEPERAQAGYQQVFRDGMVRDYPLEIRHRDGKVTPVLYNASTFRNEAGEIVGVFAAARDISKLMQTERELWKLSTAIEQCPVSIVITDVQGSIEFVNPKFTQLTGYTPEEAIGQNPRILKTGETPPELYRQLWDTISSGKVWLGEFHNRKKNGELFWEFATISPVKNQLGTITNYIAIKEDITERRNLENQLRQAQKMEAIGTLTGGIAHDFNNILSAIIGFSSLMEMNMAKDDPLHDNVVQILAAANRAAILVKSMLAFSRKQAIEVKTVILNDILAGMEQMLRRLIREDIELRIKPAATVLTILADAGQIEQVLLNLTTNAKDSMPAGGTIIITTERAELDESFRSAHGYGEPGSYALITFADSGDGMEKSVQERIFEPFFTTKEVGKGTGLGLAVCYGIIKQHHGFIVCYSEPGKGTTFRIYLPLSRSAAEQNSATAALPISGGTETILVAEDDAGVRDLTTSILREFGYTVIEAEDGAEAVARFVERSGEIQLCLFDVIMPKKSGRDAYEEIRQLRSGVKVLFMSGYQTEISGHDGLLQEGIDLITKPVAPREMLKRIREVLDR